jgi:hypothetical protein
MEKTIVQKLQRPITDIYKFAEMYYTILADVNSLPLTQRDIELIAFTAIKGNISYANLREEFCQKYGSSLGTINNMISKLKKLYVLVREGNKLKVNPSICFKSFDNNLTLVITLTHG